MKKPFFKPKTNIEEYLDNLTNLSIYKELLKKGFINNPLDFFNLLYKQYEIVIENQTTPLSIREHLESLDIEKEIYFFLLKVLSKVIENKIINSESPEKERLTVCLDLINDLNVLPVTSIPVPEIIVLPYSWEKIQKKIDQNANEYDKLIYLLELKRELKINLKDTNNHFAFIKEYERLLSLVNDEIEYYQSLLELTKEKKTELFPTDQTSSNALVDQEKHETEDYDTINETRNIITKHFDSIFNEEGCGKVFKNNADYDTYVNILLNFFTQNEKDNEKHQIVSLKKRTQTNVAYALKEIHKELGQIALKKDLPFLKIVKLLSPFSKMDENRIYRTLIK